LFDTLSELKGEFVDEPRRAVRGANELVGQVLDELEELFRRQRFELEQGPDSERTSTEMVVGESPGRGVRRVGLRLSSKASSIAGVPGPQLRSPSRPVDRRVADLFAAEARVAS
jgi:hypothetical protein